eukprot:GHRR01035245.1.p1 GENE.GHRR01035245.1~~GHRR01035245.1.p1  ORF type:complete len:253 (+),score=123.27 GHRR01035245.1:121-879(+)
MASFQAPPGHLSQAEVLIISSLVDFQLTVNAPDPDLEAPCLTTADGQKVQSTAAIARYVAEAGKTNHLYPHNNQQQLAEVDNWVDVAAALERAAAAWVQPTCQQATDKDREAGKGFIEQTLAQIEQQLQSSSHLVGPSLTLADIAVLCAALPLFQSLLGAGARKPYAAITNWINSCSQNEHIKRVLGEVRMCAAESGWVVPAVPAKVDKKKKKGKSESGAAPQQEQQQQLPAENGKELDPEKAAKKVMSLAA